MIDLFLFLLQESLGNRLHLGAAAFSLCDDHSTFPPSDLKSAPESAQEGDAHDVGDMPLSLRAVGWVEPSPLRHTRTSLAHTSGRPSAAAVPLTFC